MRRERIGRYRLIERLPQGRLGEVWRGRDERSGREVAVRVLPALFFSSDDERRAFRQAALSLLRAHHPNVADTIDFVSEDGAHAVIAEFVAGETLAAVIKRGRMAEPDAARIAAQIAEGLASGHDRGVVHRVLNPRNVVIAPDGDDPPADVVLAGPDTAPIALARSSTRVVSFDDGMTIEMILAAVRADDGAKVLGPTCSTATPARPGAIALTPREVEILTRIARGFSTREVSEQLGISPRTVENHKRRIFAKLDVQNQAHAVAIATRAGLLEAG